MAYSFATLAQARGELAQRLYLDLGDATREFWLPGELDALLVESLRTWNALTGFWRGQFNFTTASGVRWYDLTDATALPQTLRALTVTDQQVCYAILYALLEPPQLAPWIGSSQFALADIAGALARRRDELLSLTGCTLTRTTLPALPGRTYVSDSAIDIRRVSYLTASGASSPLTKSDAGEQGGYNQGYTVAPAGTPSTYLAASQPPLSFDTDAPPLPGTYDILTVNAGAALAPQTSPSKLSLPDDWTWVVKFGALADVLGRESLAKDVGRARYAEFRYRQGAAALAMAPAILAAFLANQPIEVYAVTQADQYRSGWEAEAAGTPDSLVVAGLNLIALVTKPDATPRSVTLQVVENAPVPAADGDFIQLGRDDYDALIDYAQHLAAFKLGGAEFAATIPLYERFMKQAAVYNARLRELGTYEQWMARQSQVEERANPRLDDAAVVTEVANA